jgi:hypothetical protein
MSFQFPTGIISRSVHRQLLYIAYVFSEVKNSVTVAEQEAWELVKGKCFPQLLCGPLRGRMSGHIEVQDATSVMGQHQKHVEYLEADRRHREEVDRNQLLRVILQECAPGLRRGFAGAHDVYAETTLPDVAAKLEKFAVDAGCILFAHFESKRCPGQNTPSPKTVNASSASAGIRC